MSAALPSIQLPVDYNNLFNEITDFLVTFKQDTLSSDATRNENEDENLDAENIEQHLLEKGPKYMAMLQKVANRELNSVIIDLDDILQYQNEKFLQGTQADDLVSAIQQNANHFTELFCRAIDNNMPLPTKEIDYKDDVLDVILNQRRLREFSRTGPMRSEAKTSWILRWIHPLP